jgi:hypothetical protein
MMAMITMRVMLMIMKIRMIVGMARPSLTCLAPKTDAPDDNRTSEGDAPNENRSIELLGQDVVFKQQADTPGQKRGPREQAAGCDSADLIEEVIVAVMMLVCHKFSPVLSFLSSSRDDRMHGAGPTENIPKLMHNHHDDKHMSD